MPKISVIIPVYNTGRYLANCLDSVLAQTFSDFEAICVNDGSTDNCADILKEYAQKDKRIKIITQKNQGLSGARNTGVKHISGDYTLFLDSDDSLPQYALKTFYDIVLQTKAPLVASRKLSKTILPEPPFQYQVIQDQVLKHFVSNRKIHSSACNKLYQSSILKKHTFEKGIYFEDWPFLMTLMAKVSCYATTDTPCYVYREDNTSITRSSFTQKKVDSYLRGIQIVSDFYQNHADRRSAQKRMAVALKMMINKTYKSRDRALQNYAYQKSIPLLKQKIVHWSDLPVKTLFRLWRMKSGISR